MERGGWGPHPASGSRHRRDCHERPWWPNASCTAGTAVVPSYGRADSTSLVHPICAASRSHPGHTAEPDRSASLRPKRSFRLLEHITFSLFGFSVPLAPYTEHPPAPCKRFILPFRENHWTTTKRATTRSNDIGAAPVVVFTADGTPTGGPILGRPTPSNRGFPALIADVPTVPHRIKDRLTVRRKIRGIVHSEVASPSTDRWDQVACD